LLNVFASTVIAAISRAAETLLSGLLAAVRCAVYECPLRADSDRCRAMHIST
jgi:hypothetical protein